MADLKMADAAADEVRRGTPVLSVQNLEAWYGESHILHGINFNVNAGEVVTLLGRNGAGKTTTLKSVMGIIGKRTGSIRFGDQDIITGLVGQDRAHGRRVLPRGARHFRQPRRARKPAAAADRARGRAVAGPDLRAVSEPEGTAQQPGHQTVGRRAADAGDRPDPAHRRAVPDAGRADRRSGPGHHPADRPHHRAAQERRVSRSSWSNRISGSRRPSRTATTSSSTARSSTVSRTRICRPTWTSFTPISASERQRQKSKEEILHEKQESRLYCLAPRWRLAPAASLSRRTKTSRSAC